MSSSFNPGDSRLTRKDKAVIIGGVLAFLFIIFVFLSAPHSTSNSSIDSSKFTNPTNNISPAGRIATEGMNYIFDASHSDSLKNVQLQDGEDVHTYLVSRQPDGTVAIQHEGLKWTYGVFGPFDNGHVYVLLEPAKDKHYVLDVQGTHSANPSISNIVYSYYQTTEKSLDKVTTKKWLLEINPLVNGNLAQVRNLSIKWLEVDNVAPQLEVYKTPVLYNSTDSSYSMVYAPFYFDGTPGKAYSIASMTVSIKSNTPLAWNANASKIETPFGTWKLSESDDKPFLNGSYNYNIRLGNNQADVPQIIIGRDNNPRVVFFLGMSINPALGQEIPVTLKVNLLASDDRYLEQQSATVIFKSVGQSSYVKPVAQTEPQKMVMIGKILFPIKEVPK